MGNSCLYYSLIMGNVICKVSEEKAPLQDSHYWNTFDWNFVNLTRLSGAQVESTMLIIDC